MKKCIIPLLVLLFGIEPCAAHDKIIFTPERVSKAVKLTESDSLRKAGMQEIISIADKQATAPQLGKSDYIALAHAITHDKKYADALITIVRDAAKAEPRSSEEMMARKPAWRSDLGTAHRCWLAAVAYDEIRGLLPAGERKEIAKGLEKSLIEPCLGDWLNASTRIHTLNSMGHNWWSSCVSNAGVLALALRDDLPSGAASAAMVREALPQWFGFEGDVLQRKPRSFDRTGGGMYEGPSYTSFGAQEALQFLLAWKKLNPSDDFKDIPQLKQLPNYFLNVCYPRTGIMYNLNFGDSHKNVCAESPLMLLTALGIFNEKEMQWYLANLTQGQHRDGWFMNKPMGFLFTPAPGRATTPSISGKSAIFPDMGLAVMRSSWDKDATMLAVKSGFTWNHSHADAGSFILLHNGEDIIKDGGNCWYPNPEYRGYFFQSQAHNVVLLDGKGQPEYQQYHGSAIAGSVSSMLDTENIRYVLADATGPNADHFHRWFRHFLWIGNVIFIIDDIGSYRPGELQWLWHPNGTARKSGNRLMVENGKSSVAIYPVYPRPLAYSDFVHDYPDDMWWEKVDAPTENLKGTEQYWAFHLPGATDKALALNAIILDPTTNKVCIEPMEGKNWKGVRVTDNGTVTDLYLNTLATGGLMHSNSWIDADGWLTDSYMFAITYPEGTSPLKASELTLVYGSALRNGSAVIHSGLSKESLTGSISNSRLEIKEKAK